MGDRLTQSRHRQVCRYYREGEGLQTHALRLGVDDEDGRYLELKGMVMMRRYLVIVGIAVTVLGVVVLAGVSGSGRGPARWEYGIFRGEGVWTWYGPGEAVDNGDARDFANRIGAAYSQRGDQLEANVLNGLAARGWEVVATPEQNKYVLRRPK